MMFKLSIQAKFMTAALPPALFMLLIWVAGSHLVRRSSEVGDLQLLLVGVGLAGSILVGLLAAILLANSLSRRLQALIEATEVVSSGWVIQTKEKSVDALGQSIQLCRSCRRVANAKV